MVKKMKAFWVFCHRISKRSRNEQFDWFVDKITYQSINRKFKLIFTFQKCHYCRHTGATIGCCIPDCSYSFHLNCGLKNNCLNQFTSEFKSFCHRHVERTKGEKYSTDRVCIICYEEMGDYDKIQSVFATCCKSEWFHKICLMKLADSAGYFFKCPKCNDAETFGDECMKRGIFIPQR